MQQKYDIIVIGTGPAGCITAKHISSEYKVLLIDKGNFPRNKPCGGVLIEESIEFIRNFNPPKSIFSFPKKINLIYNDIDLGKKIIQNRSWWNINRNKFDLWLFRTLKNIEISLDTRFIDLKENSKYIKILIEKNGKRNIIYTKYLIGADGALSSVRPKISSIPIRKYFAIQEWIKSKSNLNSFVYILCSKITDYYSWIIPKDDYIIIGSALPLKMSKNFEIISNFLKKKLKIEGNFVRKEGHPILRPLSQKNFVFGKGNILLVGEAAGLINPFTSEGISFALRSGYNCARALNEDFKNGLEVYKKHNTELINELKDKIKKAKYTSNIKGRKKLVRYMSIFK